VSEVWPQFCGQTQTPRPGEEELLLDKAELTVGEAIAHRGGLTDLTAKVVMAHLASAVLGWRRAWDAGIASVEEHVPRWAGAREAGYHFVSWSWIIGGIVERVTGRHIAGAPPVPLPAQPCSF